MLQIWKKKEYITSREKPSCGGETVKKVKLQRPGPRKAAVVRSRSQGRCVRPQGEEPGEIGELRQALSQAAQIYFSETAATAEEKLPFSAYHFADVSLRLEVPMEVLQGWIEEYETVLAADVSWDERMITHEGIKKLAAIQEMKEQGVSDAKVRGMLQAQPDPSLVQERIDELLAAMERVGMQRERDRYIFLKEITRAREEIQHLRYELVAAIPRRGRRKSLWSRLVGS